MDNLFVVIGIFVTILNLPCSQQFPGDWSKAPYSQHTLMLSNFNPRYSYKPEDFMSAFSDIIQNSDVKQENEQFEEADAQTSSPQDAKKDVPNQNDEENDSLWPFRQINPKSGNVYSSFFPIMIQGGTRGFSREAGEYAPGSSTAIANSFSTGRGGVASSHATSLGDPYLSMLFRNAILKKGLEKNE